MRNIFRPRKLNASLYLRKGGKVEVYHWYTPNWRGFWPLFRVLNENHAIFIETKYLTFHYHKE